MTSPQTINPESLEGLQVVDGEGSKVGKVTTVFLDTQSNQPEWVAVKTGFFGNNETLVPLSSAQLAGDELRVPYAKSVIKDAPHHDPTVDLSTADEQELYRHYDQSYESTSGSGATGSSYDRSTETSTAGSTGGQTFETGGERTTFETDQTAGAAGAVGAAGTTEATGRNTGYDTSGPTTDEAMTRSEEQLHVGTERVETGRARLRKYVVTEQVTQTVPVSHEEVRIEREPITDANVGNALDGPEISEEEHEVVLHAERPVVGKETVPVERVRLDTETVSEQQTVGDEIRKEQIEVDTGDAERGRDRDVR
jgi:uncharacterized protein (TIGR02271 family)